MKILTHSERFHCDEVFASALLKYLFEIEEIIRTRDKTLILEAQQDKDIFVVDVGEKYEVEMNNFDHHQTSFEDTFNEKQWIKMSSCGLIWKHFGEDIIFKFAQEEFNMELDDEEIKNMWGKIYQLLFLCIDANDNGIKQYKNIKDLNFKNSNTIYDVIASYNRDVKDDEQQLIQFKRAMEIAFETFYNKIHYLIAEKALYDKFLPDFLKALDEAEGKDYLFVEDDDVMVEKYLNDFDKEKKIKFMIAKRYDEHYRIYTRKKMNGSFEIEKPLITQQNAKVLVKDDLIFIHKIGFVGATKTFESAVKIVEASI